MGGEWIPKSFVKAPHEVWGYALRIVRDNDWYRCVAIRRQAPAKLLIRDGKKRSVIEFQDSMLEIFALLKSAGDDSALIVDRMFQRCWICPTWELAEDYLDYTNEIDDWDTSPLPSESA